MNREQFERQAHERRQAIADRYDQLRSYRRTGDEFGISGQRVQQIVKRVQPVFQRRGRGAGCFLQDIDDAFQAMHLVL